VSAHPAVEALAEVKAIRKAEATLAQQRSRWEAAFRSAEKRYAQAMAAWRDEADHAVTAGTPIPEQPTLLPPPGDAASFTWRARDLKERERSVIAEHLDALEEASIAQQDKLLAAARPHADALHAIAAELAAEVQAGGAWRDASIGSGAGRSSTVSTVTAADLLDPPSSFVRPPEPVGRGLGLKIWDD
jgi:hypothetical protein